MKAEKILHLLTMFNDSVEIMPTWFDSKYFMNSKHKELFQLLITRKDTNEFYEKNQDIFVAVNIDSMANQSELPMLCSDLKDDCNLHWSKTKVKRLLNDFENGSITIYDFQQNLTEFTSKMNALTSTGPVHIMEAASRAYKESIEAKNNPSLRKFISTGWDKLDKKWTLYKKKVHIVAARPSMGKSAFGQYVSILLSKQGHKGLFFSIEMPESHIASRITASESGVNSMILLKGSDDLPHIWESIQGMENIPLFIDCCKNPTINHIVGTIRQSKPDYVVIDHLAHIPIPKGADKRNFIDTVMTELEVVADHLNIPIIALHQLNRQVEYRDDKHPMISDLKESGEIEQKAESVVLLYRPEYYITQEKKTFEPRNNNKFMEQMADTEGILESIKDKIEINIAKMRGGETGKIDARFNKPVMRFEDWT